MTKRAKLSLLVVSIFLIMLTACHSKSGSGLSSITVTPSVTALGPGTTLQFTAEGTYSDGKTEDLTESVQWSSSNETVATIGNDSNNKGLLTSRVTGTATITATSDSVTASIDLTITSTRANDWQVGLGSPLYGITSPQAPLMTAVGKGLIMSSPSGSVWTVESSPTSKYLWGVAWSNPNDEASKFLAVGEDGIMLSSLDGSLWTALTPTVTDKYLWDVTSFKKTGQFVAVGETGTVLLTSPSGTLISSQTITSIYLSGVASDLSTIPTLPLVAVGENGAIYTSETGTTWQQRDSGTSNYLWDVAWAGDKFIAVGSNGTVLTSSDVVSWATRSSNVTNYLVQIACREDSHLCVAVGSGGTVLTSSDGINWTTATSGTTSYLWSVAWSGEWFVVTGLDGTILISQDASTWTQISSVTVKNVTASARSDIEYAAVGSGGLIMTSPTGSHWDITSVGKPVDFNGIATNGIDFVAVGTGGAVYTSPEGTTSLWSEQTPTTNDLNSVAWSDTLYLYTAVGNAGTVIYSYDGNSWASATTPSISGFNMNGVAWSDTLSMFIAVGASTVDNSGTIITSSDGVNWSTVTNTSQKIVNVAWSGSQFVAALANGGVLTSSDGTTWQ
jgi:hypothetical protein